MNIFMNMFCQIFARLFLDKFLTMESPCQRLYAFLNFTDIVIFFLLLDCCTNLDPTNKHSERFHLLHTLTSTVSQQTFSSLPV